MNQPAHHLAAVVAAVLVTACGGSSPPAPSSTSTSAPSGVSACGAIGGSASPTLAILYGTVCNAPASPVVLVNLYDQSGSRYGLCSGTVIAKRAVLTAAHCLAAPTASVSVFLGSGDTIAASAFTSFPGYRGVSDPSSVDLGVVATAQDLAPTPIPILASRDPRIGEQAVVAGWGQSETNTLGSLRAGTTTLAGVGTFLQITSSGPSASGVCYGDSGGPLLLSEGGTWAVAGVTSAFSGNSCSIATSSFTNLRNADASAFLFGTVPAAGRK